MDVRLPTMSAAGEELLERARALRPLVLACSPEIEEGRRLPARLVEAMKAAGLFAMPIPHDWGGPELDPLEQLAIIEELAKMDASVGWCAMIGCDGGYFTAFLDQDAARKMYPDIHVATASALSVTGRAVRVTGGYRVGGRWPFSSGCQHSAWLVGGCIVHDGDRPILGETGVPLTRQCFLRPDEVSILDTWHTTGLRGSGSNDFTASDVFVPEERTFDLRNPTIRRPGPLYAFPLAILLKFAAVPLGVARAAIDELVDAAGHRPARPFVVGDKPAAARLLRDEPFVQEALSRAELMAGSARSYLYETTGDMWAALVRSDLPSPGQLARWQLAVLNAFDASSQAVQLVYKARGGSAVYAEGKLDRRLRDILTMNQHVAVSLKTHEIAGRGLLGLEPMQGLL
jgi:alkylation response protein AidB-like acyl-CoA dehydrogenase